MADDVRDPEQEARIQALKDRVMELSRGHMVSSESSSLPLDVQEDFWRRVVEAAEGPTTTLTRELEARAFSCRRQTPWTTRRSDPRYGP